MLQNFTEHDGVEGSVWQIDFEDIAMDEVDTVTNRPYLLFQVCLGVCYRFFGTVDPRDMGVFTP